jgi:hypothetical protein
MEFNCGDVYKIDMEIKSPMGWVKLKGGLTIDEGTDFHGCVKLMGIEAEMKNCVRNGSDFKAQASPKLPFGILEVSIEVAVAEDGTVSGTAYAPRHKPMELRGNISL